MIKIVMDDGERLFWDADEYTDYEANYGLFIVKNGDRWIGIYNMDHLLFVEVDDRSEIFEGFNVTDQAKKDAQETARAIKEKLGSALDELKKTAIEWKKERPER